MSPFDLNLRHLRALDVIIKKGRMRAAAEAIGLSQPSLTQGIAQLERQLGTKLFERLPHGVAPTDAGLIMASRSLRAYGYLGRAVPKDSGGGTRRSGRTEHLMTTTQLRALTILAEAGSFVDAAITTGLSEPSLHRAVRDLERTLGVPLAERKGRGIELTGAGKRLARGARLAASEIAGGIAELLGLSANDVRLKPRIVIGAMPLARARILPVAIAAHRAFEPLATIEVVDGSWRELVEPLRDGLIDMLIGALREVPPQGLVQEELFRDRLVVVARAGHPLIGTDPGLAALAAYPWIVGRPGSPLRAQWNRMFQGREVEAAVECGSATVMRGILLETDMLTLLSPEQMTVDDGAGILAIVYEPSHGLQRTIGITTRSGWHPTTVQRRMLDLLRASYRVRTVTKTID